jgi:hypothetical protein
MDCGADKGGNTSMFLQEGMVKYGVCIGEK